MEIEIESDIHFKNGMVEDAKAEEKESKCVQSFATENEDDDGEKVVAAHISSPTAGIALFS